MADRIVISFEAIIELAKVCAILVEEVSELVMVS